MIVVFGASSKEQCHPSNVHQDSKVWPSSSSVTTNICHLTSPNRDILHSIVRMKVCQKQSNNTATLYDFMCNRSSCCFLRGEMRQELQATEEEHYVDTYYNARVTVSTSDQFSNDIKV